MSHEDHIKEEDAREDDEDDILKTFNYRGTGAGGNTGGALKYFKPLG
jgi:hypothetical protein